jgi:threonyl-tRNA synthetase
MQNKIRVAQEQKVPLMLVLGDREVEARSATVRRRGAARDAVQESVAWEDLAERLAAEVAARRVD